MTPKEKSDELFNKFRSHTKVFHEVLGCEDHIDLDKQCALIAIDEIIQIDVLINEDIYVEKPSYLQYWQEVKQELEKLKNETK